MPTSSFSEQVPSTNLDFKLLPFYHTCSAFKARKFISSDSISDQNECEVFNEKITYLFYGRPAFKYQVSSESNRDWSLYPVAFVLDGDMCGPLKRVFPFDSGAMHHQFYKAFFNPEMTVFDFELEPNNNRIKDVVAHFYGANAAYERFKPKRFQPLDTADFESLCFAEMIRSIAGSPADERRATIEVQANERISLSVGSVRGLIVPGPLSKSQLFRDFARKHSFVVHPYDITTWNPGQCFGILQNEAKKLALKIQARERAK